MKRKILSGKDLVKLGFPEGRATGMAINTVLRYYRRWEKEEIFDLLRAVIADPKACLKDSIWRDVALELLPKERKSGKHELRKNRIEYNIFGANNIEESARNQMEIAMKLPVTLAGSLMPDAHHGFGLPIGGVLATDNAVIPYAVGVDIGCRMCLTVYPLGEVFLERHKSNLKQILLSSTRFGNDSFDKPKDHEILHRKTFDEIQMLKSLQGRAARQIGTSGSGNHFVEFGMVALKEGNDWQLTPGKYLAVLSHSGSRGLGAEIARHFTKVARSICHLPAEASSLAWLDLNTQPGQEYWLAMNLAGEYAKANHDQIHERIADALAEEPLLKVENHHNFAWKEEMLDGTTAVVHRKGATPAGEGVYGIIPGSMTTPGFLVRGKGSRASLQSASHGAGRVMSRSAAKSSITMKMMRQELQRAEVELIGGGIDEAPMAYKDIEKVIGYQRELIEVVGEFQPKIVRMCGDDTPSED